MIIRGAGLLVGFLVLGAPASAQETVADFYKGKQIRVIVPSAAGGGFDLYARYLSRHLGRYIPGNPTFVVQNMPGAGGLAAANHLYTRAAKDGLTIGTLQGPSTYAQVGNSPNVQYRHACLRLARQRQRDLQRVCVHQARRLGDALMTY